MQELKEVMELVKENKSLHLWFAGLNPIHISRHEVVTLQCLTVNWPI